MKLLRLCVVTALATGVAAIPRFARTQALGEAATLSAGVSSAGSASGSSLGNSIGRAMGSAGSRIAPSSKTSTAGGVTNLHWSREQLERSAKTTQTQAKGNAKAASKDAQPDFVILGADPQNEDSGDASVNHPKPTDPSASQPKAPKDKGPSGQDGRN